MPVRSENIQGAFSATPQGIILHATRSGVNRLPYEEYRGTMNYVRSGADGKAWHVTIGSDNRLARHMGLGVWGWHVRDYSPTWIGAEFAQGVLGGYLPDDYIDTFAVWYVTDVLAAWPNIKLFEWWHHSEVAPGILDGNTDVFERGTPEATEFKNRLRTAVASLL